MTCKWIWFCLSLCVLLQQINGLFGVLFVLCFSVASDVLWHRYRCSVFQGVNVCTHVNTCFCDIIQVAEIVTDTFWWLYIHEGTFLLRGLNELFFLSLLVMFECLIPSKILVPQAKRYGHSTIHGWYLNELVPLWEEWLEGTGLVLLSLFHHVTMQQEDITLETEDKLLGVEFLSTLILYLQDSDLRVLYFYYL